MMSKPLRSQRRRAPGLVLAAFAALALPLAGIASNIVDDYFESDLDGMWTGVLVIDRVTTPAQLNVNVTGSAGVGFIVLPEINDETQTIVTLPVTIESVTASNMTLRLEETDTATQEVSTTTLDLSLDPDTDALTGKVAGARKGTAALVRGNPDLPLQRAWEGSVEFDGVDTFTVIQFVEATDDTGRFAPATVSGHALLGQVEGTLTGERNGSQVTFAVTTDSGQLDFDLKLTKKDNQLSGQVRRTGQARLAGVKFLPAGGDGKGKSVKVKSASPNEIEAGATSSVALKGANLGPGSVVHTDRLDVNVVAVEVDSKKGMTIELSADAGASGDVSLRLVSSDGQVSEKNKALSLAATGGATVSFAAAVQPTLSNSCALAGCHSAASGAAGLVLASGASFANLVNLPSSQQPSLMRVRPGDAEASYLVRKVRGDSGISGGRMPLNQTPLNDAEIQAIIDWINQGAVNNRRPGGGSN